MGVSFFEVMRGELRDKWGRPHLAEFQIKAEANRLGAFARSGDARVTGIVNAAPWAEGVPVSGTMKITPLLRREIAYDLRFEGADGGPSYRLTGKKSIKLTRVVHSMTHMPVSLRRNGEEIARGELRFDTNELLSFMTSWFPSSSFKDVRLHSRTDGIPSGALSASERDLIAALAQAVIVPDGVVDAPDAQTLEGAARIILSGPEHTVVGFRMALRLLDATAALRHRRAFAALSLDERRELLAEMTRAPIDSKVDAYLPPHLLVRVLTAPIKMAHFGRDAYLGAIGHPPHREVREEKPPKYFQRVVEAESLEEETVLEADVVIVGTGAGGAALAASLAKKGYAVAMVEEGRFRRRHDFVGSPLERIANLWRYSGMSFTVGTTISIPLGKVVGGTTTINSATCFETPDSVLQEWRDQMGFPDDFAPERYHRYSQEVRRVLQVAPGDAKALGRIAHVLGRGADAMGLGHGPLPRNAPGCPGVGECIFGCPEGAKRSADVSWVPQALAAGAQLFVGLPVTRILMDGPRAVAVEARGADKLGRARLLRIHARRIVLSCGSLVTPTLLMENGCRLPQLGKNLSVHPGVGMIARCPEDLQPWDAIPQGYAIHGMEDKGIRYEGFYLPPAVLAGATTWQGEELTSWMNEFSKLAQFGFMTRDRSNGSVHRGPAGQTVVVYKLDSRSRQQIKQGAALLGELFLAGGATEVDTSIRTVPVIRDKRDCQRLLDSDPHPMDFGLLGAHPLGTCRMGKSPDTAVIDFDYRVFGTENLHVVDGSAVPSSLGVNPQMTIMAFALRAADIIADKIDAEYARG